MRYELKTIENHNVQRAPDLEWDKLFKEFISKSDFSSNTAKSYKRRLRSFEGWLLNNLVKSPSKQDIIDYKKEITAQLSSPLSVSNYLTAVRRFFNWLEVELIYPNVTKDIKNPPKPRGFRKDALDLEQVKRLLSSIDRTTLIGKRDFALINLMIRTGERTIEIARATTGDIQKKNGKHILWLQGKGRLEKDEFVVLTSSALSPIEDYLLHRGRLPSSSPLFASHSSNCKEKSLGTRSIRRIVKNHLKSIHINSNRLSAHSLRHTTVTLALMAGASLQEVKELARHSNVNTTLIYAHNINRTEGIAEALIDELI